MKYTSGKIGRTFVLKFDNNDDFLDEIQKMVKKEKIKTAFFVFLGALKNGKIVVGPKKPVLPPVPNWKDFREAWEVFGVGSVFSDRRKKQHIHVHTSFGKGSKTLTGCIRKKAKVFIVIEAVLFELKGVKAGKNPDPETGLNMLKLY